LIAEVLDDFMHSHSSRPPGEWVVSGTVPALAGLEVVEARFSTRSFPLHAHDEYVIGAVVAGAKQSWHGRRSFVAAQGCLTLFNPHEEHSSVGVGNAWHFAGFYPPEALLEEWFGASFPKGRAPLFSRNSARDRAGVELILGFVRSMSRIDSILARQSIFVGVITHFLDRHMGASRESPPAMPALLRVREFLDANYDGDVSLRQLAAIDGISPSALLGGFRKAFGCTPRVYMTSKRIAAAKREIIAGMPLAQVAAGCGFCDQGHFTRVFGRWTGMTPSLFSRSLSAARG
jgi:AraC-like DNA-binding protein